MSSLKQRIETKPLDPNDNLAVTKAVRDWLSDPEHWCHGTAFRKKEGVIAATWQEAEQTCLLGARFKVLKVDFPGFLDCVWAEYLGFGSLKDLIAFNDIKGYDRVMAMLDSIINFETWRKEHGSEDDACA